MKEGKYVKRTKNSMDFGADKGPILGG